MAGESFPQSNPDGNLEVHPSENINMSADENSDSGSAEAIQEAERLKNEAIEQSKHPEASTSSNDTEEDFGEVLDNNFAKPEPSGNEEDFGKVLDEFENSKIEHNELDKLETEQPTKSSNENGEFVIDHPAEPEPASKFESTESDHPAEPETEPESETKVESELESEVEPEAEIQEDNRETGEKSRAEQRLESLRVQINNINQEIIDTNSEKERLKEQIVKYETALDENFSEHETLLGELDGFSKEVKETKRNLITDFTNGLKIVKNLMLGKHEEVRNLLKKLEDNVNKNETALNNQAKTETEIEANEQEKNNLEASRADASDNQKKCVDKIIRLERQKAEINKRIELLQEEIAEEKQIEAWKAARQEVRSKMEESNAKNAKEYRSQLNTRERNLNEELNSDLEELNTYRNPSRVQRLMRTEEERERDKIRADEVEKDLVAEHEKNISDINAARQEVDQYFPTLPERIKDIKENDRVRGALSTLKRKILMRVYGIS